jgi:hypothetical protein
MTLVEFLSPITGSRNKDRCLSVLYYKQRYEQKGSMTAAQVHSALVHARTPNAKSVNVADILNKSGALVDSPGAIEKARLWSLTKAGENYVRTLLKFPESQPEIEHEVTLLKTLAAKISDKDVREYIEEAIKCMEVDALRAAIVFTWTGAIRVLQERCIAQGLSEINAAIQVHDSKARQVKKLDDFAYIKDSIQLLAAEGVGLLDKGQRSTLGEALDLRNRCGHPTKYSPGIKKASSFLEDVSGILFK